MNYSYRNDEQTPHDVLTKHGWYRSSRSGNIVDIWLHGQYKGHEIVYNKLGDYWSHIDTLGGKLGNYQYQRDITNLQGYLSKFHGKEGSQRSKIVKIEDYQSILAKYNYQDTGKGWRFINKDTGKTIIVQQGAFCVIYLSLVGGRTRKVLYSSIELDTYLEKLHGKKESTMNEFCEFS